jgi:transcriptional regulator with XRE-family HTH domain
MKTGLLVLLPLLLAGCSRSPTVSVPTVRPEPIRELRDKARLTQEQLAERAGVKHGAVARWERGERTFLGSVVALSNALNVSWEAFLEAPTQEVVDRRPGRPRKPTGQPPPPALEAAPKSRKGKGEVSQRPS